MGTNFPNEHSYLGGGGGGGGGGALTRFKSNTFILNKMLIESAIYYMYIHVHFHKTQKITVSDTIHLLNLRVLVSFLKRTYLPTTLFKTMLPETNIFF